jgi:hypothetical protein
MRNMCSLMTAISLSLLAFGPTAAFANSSNPKCDGPFICTHGNSNNECTGDHCKKTGPSGNNCTAQGKGLCK